MKVIDVDRWFDENPTPPKTIWVETERYKKFRISPLAYTVETSHQCLDGGNFHGQWGSGSMTSYCTEVNLPWETTEEQAKGILKQRFPGYQDSLIVILGVEDVILGENQINPEYRDWLEKKHREIPPEIWREYLAAYAE